MSEVDYQKELTDIKIGAKEHYEFEAKEAKRKFDEAEKEALKNKEREDEFAKQKAINDKLESELKAKQDAELKAKKEAEAKLESERKEAEKLLKAPIKKQLNVWVNSFELPTTTVDNLASKEIKAKFNAFKEWALKQVETI